ncbi:thioether cross-link-forming SCIFF peptide maturase [Anaerocolumna aminovalerica]|uniref:thioether cross-link-forming SCIFF peptide maturase n=1 Tax=Anaerocolumna aminovalerica TaxID=1527 RepID=UPI000BE3AED5|nr:thioether cross-link-forming SCIFF peptide maturase [Anaerocolumna aminovalerica]
MIHQYKNNGYNIVLDVNSGMIHVVDDVAYDIIALFDKLRDTKTHMVSEKDKETIVAEIFNKYNKPEYAELFEIEPGNYDEMKSAIQESILDVEQLVKDGALFTEDIYENYINEFKNRETVVKALCLHIAHDCNLACRYCFAEEGEYHGHRELMSYEVGKRALDFLIANSGNRRNLEVDFFGGEPLMNFEVVKELVKYGREQEKLHNKKFRFTLTTNGILLDNEVEEFLNKEMSNVVLSIDGRKEVNDLMRPSRNGKGSYDIIIPKFIKLAEDRNQTNYYVRGTFTRNNLDFSEDVKHFAELGFKQISVEPVVSLPEESYSIREEDIPKICQEYDKLAKYMLKKKKEGKDFNFFHFMIDLSGGPCVAKRLSGCGSGTEYLAVTPWGDFYPCHQFVGETEYLMGNVYEGIKRTDLREDFKECNVYSKEKCKKCFARFYCSGGCAANSYKFQGQIDDAYDIGCELQRKRVECAIMLKAAEAVGEE